ncbi:MAG TPA: YlxR family protein [Acidimicrobiia bacterium]
MVVRRRARTCVGCRTSGTPDAGWRRCARDAAGRIGVGKLAPGRGAWVCSPECFDTAMRRGSLARALRADPTSVDGEGLRATLFNTSDRPGDPPR